jgi:phage terminase large subunit-like protein
MDSPRPLVVSETRGERVCRFIETHLRVPEGALVGRPVRLAAFQRRFILEVYDNPAGTRRAYLSMARKNAKTSLIAFLVLAHLIGPEAQRNSQIVSGGLTRAQAALVFDLMVKTIRLNPRLVKLVHIVDSLKRAKGLALGTEYRALSAQAGAAHGLSPAVAILDEIGQIDAPTSPFVEAIVTAQGAYAAPLLFAISTSARDDNALFSIWLDDAKRSGDSSIVSHEYRAPAGCELDDRAAWLAANPALGLFRSEADLEKAAERAARLPSEEAQFRNLFLNQRIALESLFISPGLWRDNAAAPELELMRANRCAVGLDLSARGDLTAAVVAARDEESDQGAVHLLPFVFTPLGTLGERSRRDRAPYEQWTREGFMIAVPGDVIEYEFVAGYLARELEALGIDPAVVAFDRWRINEFKRSAIDAGFAGAADWQPVPQSYSGMSPRLESFEALLLQKRIRHGGHPLLTMAAANAVTKVDPQGNRVLNKERGRRRIDPLVAAVMAAFAVADGQAAGFDEKAWIG